MPVPRGTRYRIKTYASGKRVRIAISPSGKVVETKTLPRTNKTKTAKRLNKRRKRLSL